MLTSSKNGLQPKLQHIVLNGGASRDRTEDLLIKSQWIHLLTLILIRLTVTLVACCVTKYQEVPIRLAQIWHSNYRPPGGAFIKWGSRTFLNFFDRNFKTNQFPKKTLKPPVHSERQIAFIKAQPKAVRLGKKCVFNSLK